MHFGCVCTLCWLLHSINRSRVLWFFFTLPDNTNFLLKKHIVCRFYFFILIKQHINLCADISTLCVWCANRLRVWVIVVIKITTKIWWWWWWWESSNISNSKIVHTTIRKLSQRWDLKKYKFFVIVHPCIVFLFFSSSFYFLWWVFRAVKIKN